MDTTTSELVRPRARHRRDYCRLSQPTSALRFHVEHVIARQHGGSDDAGKGALACPECNVQKGTNLTGLDPDAGKVFPLFHSHQDRWGDHFTLDGARIVGKTAPGRTTVRLLDHTRRGIGRQASTV